MTVDPDHKKVDGCGVACTTTSSSGGVKNVISTEFTGAISEMAVPGSGPYTLSDGLTSGGGDASLFHVGAHELGHGSDRNIKITSEAASERDVGSQVLDQLKSSPDVKTQDIKRSR